MADIAMAKEIAYEKLWSTDPTVLGRQKKTVIAIAEIIEELTLGCDDAIASDLRYRELAGQTTPATSTTPVLPDSISVIEAVHIPPDGEMRKLIKSALCQLLGLFRKQRFTVLNLVAPPKENGRSASSSSACRTDAEENRRADDVTKAALVRGLHDPFIDSRLARPSSVELVAKYSHPFPIQIPVPAGAQELPPQKRTTAESDLIQEMKQYSSEDELL